MSKTKGQLRDAHNDLVLDNSRLRAVNGQLLAALEALVKRHAELVSSGDCGHWDVEQEPSMLAARAALAKATGTQS